MSAALIPLVRLEPANQPEPQLPDTATYTYQQYTARVRYDTACLLEFEPNTVMTRRVAVLSIGGHPVLSSTSYLPVGLVNDSADWHRVELGRLAVMGYPVTSVGPWQVHGRAPTTMERSVLGIRASAEIPVAVYNHSYYIHGVQPDPLQAGVVIRARSDRVLCKVDDDYSGLLLKPEPANRRR